jgi:Zn-dependent membrane protease YugP
MIVVLVGGLIIGAASWKVRRTYRRWSGVRNSTGMSGQQIARRILDGAGLSHVQVEVIDGELTDNYDPSSKVLRLSQGVAYNPSVAAEGIVAHEIGHAVQDARAFAPMRVRSAVVPAANIGSQTGVMIIILGLVLMGLRAVNLGFDIAVLGLFLFAVVFVFHLVTLPVEVDASRRAMGLLRDNDIVNHEDIAGARSVLAAAALTYVAALFASFLQLAYWGLQVFSRRD